MPDYVTIRYRPGAKAAGAATFTFKGHVIARGETADLPPDLAAWALREHGHEGLEVVEGKPGDAEQAIAASEAKRESKEKQGLKARRMPRTSPSGG